MVVIDVVMLGPLSPQTVTTLQFFAWVYRYMYGYISFLSKQGSSFFF